MIPASLDPAWLRQQLIRGDVPSHTHKGYLRYFLEGIAPGEFLCAVLMNNLSAACRHADERNAKALYEHTVFLINTAPVESWGSPERVTAWIESFHQNEVA